LDGSSFDRGDSVACELTPTDGSLSGTSVVSSTIVIENSVPTLTDVTISPANPTLGSTLTCTYSYADADGDSDLSTLAWSVNGTAAGTGATKTGGFGAGDVVTCTVTPYDGTDTGSPLSASVSAGNNPPVLSSVSLSPTTAYEGDTLTCTPGSASDPEGDAIQYSYAWTVDGASPGVSTSTLSSSYFAKNNAVRCTVTPDDGTTTGAAVASNTVTNSNSAPALASVAISPTTAYEGDTLSCTPGTATDPDGDNVSYTYAWYVNGNNNGRTSSTLSSTYFSRGDVVLCEATPTDGSAAGTALRSSGVTIANTVPTVSNVSISPTSPVYGQTLTCTYSFADVDSDSDASTIAWTVNGSAAGTGSTLSSGFHGGQTVSCTVTPRDSGGAGTARSASVTVGNTVPSLSSVSLTPTTAVEGSTLTCTPGTATDVDGDSISYTYSWLVDSASPGVSTSTLSSSYFSKNNAVRCSVTPRDATGSGTAVASNTVTIGNTAPVMTAVTLSPTLVYTNDTVTASASGSDVDGDPVSYSYAWSVNGTTIAAATGTTLSGVSYFSRGNLVSVAVTPNDGTQSGTAMSASVTIGNTAPTAPTVAVTPNPADMNNEPLLCGISTASTDVDGDSISYSMSWTADGVSYPGSMTGITGPSNTTWTRDTVPAADTDVGGTWICTVTPSDGTSSGATGSASASVLDFYDVNYPATTTGPGSAAASYLLGPSITVTSATTLYRFGALLNTAGNSARMALYTDVSGSPSTLVAYSDVFTTAVGVNEVALSTPVSLPAGTYWIMGVYSATTYVYYGSSSTASIRYKAYSYSSTPSSTFGTASSYTGYPIAYYLVVAD
ncbi:MAG TPA: hypothetical protein PLA94_12425, partial [Myxococcota bacterium]|nr:hypothetical protein [Myxococcota bacterium]